MERTLEVCPLIDELYKQKIELAEKGDREAARWLIKEFCSTIKQNRDGEGKPHRKPSGNRWT